MEKRDGELLIILPVFNEATIIEKAVAFLKDDIEQIVHHGRPYKICIVDNGSTDGTGVRALACAEGDELICVRSCNRKGRGQAIRKILNEFPHASLYCYIDIDIPLDPRDIGHMIAILDRGEADIVLPRRTGPRPLVRRMLSTGYRGILSALFGVSCHDVQAGAKAFTQTGAHILRYAHDAEDGYFLDTEFIVRATLAGLRIREVPMHWIEQRYRERKSKISPIRDSFHALHALYRIAARMHRIRKEQNI